MVGNNNAPRHGMVITAAYDRLTPTKFYFTSSGAQHGLLAHPR